METLKFIFFIFLQCSIAFIFLRRDDEMADTLKKLREWEKNKGEKHDGNRKENINQ